MGNPDITYFAETDARNRRTPFGIKDEDRSRHIYIIGKTGMGKSTTLENMAIQDVQRGNGFAFLDPHGKTADLFLEYIPEHRKKDVIYFAPFDTDFPIAFNVMEDVGYDKRHLVVSGLMSAFKKIWVDAWSARMEYILSNILLALLEYPNSTMIGVNRMLSDKEYRRKVVDYVTDPSVKLFWTDEYAKWPENYAREAGAAIQNKIGQFISNPLIRNIIGQTKSTFDIRKAMDEKKIIIVNLSKGRMGETNANLLGSMLITKIYLAALSRADQSEKQLDKLPPFYLYVDEFQNFANESFAGILSEARKYKLCLTVAHQYIEQMSDEVRAAVFGNVGTMISFRVGAYDADVLEKEFTPTFVAEDLVNLGKYQIYLKLMIDEVTSAPFSANTIPQIEKPIVSFKDEAIAESRKAYALPREVVEKEIQDWHAISPVSSGGNDKRDGERKDGGRDGGGRDAAPRNRDGDRDRGGGFDKVDRGQAEQKRASKNAEENFQFLARSTKNDIDRNVTPSPSLSQSPSPTQQSTHIQKSHQPHHTTQDQKPGQHSVPHVSHHQAAHSHAHQPPQQKVSLNHLADGKNKQLNTQKAASHTHIQGLRDALKSYIKPETNGPGVKAEEKVDEKNENIKSEHVSEDRSHQSNQSNQNNSANSSPKKEVPKDELIKILKGNDES